MATQLKEYMKRSIAICKESGPVVIAIIIPIILLPVVFTSERKEVKAGYVCLVMMGNWMMEILPLPVTALLPVVFYPLFGIADTNKITHLYMKDTIMLFFGSLVLAVALEHSNLHRRIALKVLLTMGKNLRLLLFGFMWTSMFLSMWISNSAAAAMLIPIAEVVVSEVQESRRAKYIPTRETSDPEDSGAQDIKTDTPAPSDEPSVVETQRNQVLRQIASRESLKSLILEESERIKIAFYLSVSYAANIGGTGTLTGTPPNIVLKGFLERYYPESSEITFGTWMMYNVPGAIICLILAWMYLAFVVLKYREVAASDIEALRNKIRDQYEKLGRLTFQEAAVLTLFITLVLVWIFRKPHFIEGWSSLFSKEVKIHSATPAIAVVILLFVIPAEPTNFSKFQPLLSWNVLHHNMHWSILFLIGGGYAMGEGAKISGLSAWIGKQLTVFSRFSTEVDIIILCIFSSIITEFFSNTATANVLIPVVNELAVVLKANPLYVIIPVTVSCSFAFMLPAGTPPNALVYEAGQLKLIEMIVPGLFMNFTCCIVQILLITTIGSAMFSLLTFPPWARIVLNETHTAVFRGKHL